jgi:hypothetical protein
LVGIRQSHAWVFASGDNFAVKFYRYTLAGQVKFVQQLSEVKWGCELARLAIDVKIYHFFVLN